MVDGMIFHTTEQLRQLICGADTLSQPEVQALLKGIVDDTEKDLSEAISGDPRTRQELYDTLLRQFNYEINRQNLVIEDARSRIDAISWCIDMIERQK